MTSAGASRRQIAGLITHVSQSYQMEMEASTEGKLC